MMQAWPPGAAGCATMAGVTRMSISRSGITSASTKSRPRWGGSSSNNSTPETLGAGPWRLATPESSETFPSPSPMRRTGRSRCIISM